MVPARPGVIGNDACVRSRAWIWLFSSMHNTIACSGGLRYRPTTSMSLSSNFGSLDTLNVSTRWGCKPRSDQIRCTVAGLTPTCLAIVRHDQCVAPGGVVVVVNSTIRAIVSSGIEGLRPRPSRIFSSPANPSSTNRVRHARTVTGVTPTSSAITALATPSAASNNTLACTTCRCGADCARANLSNVSRSPSDNGTSDGVDDRIPCRSEFLRRQGEFDRFVVRVEAQDEGVVGDAVAAGIEIGDALTIEV